MPTSLRGFGVSMGFSNGLIGIYQGFGGTGYTDSTKDIESSTSTSLTLKGDLASRYSNAVYFITDGFAPELYFRETVLAFGLLLALGSILVLGQYTYDHLTKHTYRHKPIL